MCVVIFPSSVPPSGSAAAELKGRSAALTLPVKEAAQGRDRRSEVMRVQRPLRILERANRGGGLCRDRGKSSRVVRVSYNYSPAPRGAVRPTAPSLPRRHTGLNTLFMDREPRAAEEDDPLVSPTRRESICSVFLLLPPIWVLGRRRTIMGYIP